MSSERERREAAQSPGRGSTTDPSGDVPNAYERTTVPVGLTGFSAGMTSDINQREAAQAPGPGSDTDPTGDVANVYKQTTVPVGLTGFTAGLADAPWDEAGSHYRREFEEAHGASGRRWEEVEPGYRYAHEQGRETRFRDQSWSEAESDLRSGYSDWSRQRGYDHDESAWDRAKETVRSVWERRGGR